MFLFHKNISLLRRGAENRSAYSLYQYLLNSAALRFGKLNTEQTRVCRRFVHQSARLKRYAPAYVRSFGTENGLRPFFGQISVSGVTETEITKVKRRYQRAAAAVRK